MWTLNIMDSRKNNIRRYNQIVAVLVKYGFRDLVAHLETGRKLPALRRLIPRRTQHEALQYSRWEKMRMACEELGPTFIKFGQVLSNRPDLLPPPLVTELEKLQDRVPPFGGDIHAIVEQELGRKTEEVFAHIEAVPLASASIAQVHRARLVTGQEVVIKVQRPGIRETVAADVHIMHRIAAALTRRIPSLKSFDLRGIISHFEDSIKKEMDFIHESINVQRFRGNLLTEKRQQGKVYAPSVFRDLTTRNILTLEFIDGVKISHAGRPEHAGLDRKIIALRLLDAYFLQIFRHGFFHADPHPGNVLIMPGNIVCFIDFGMMGSIMKKDIILLGHILLAIKARDVARIIRSFRQLSDNVVIQNQRALEASLDDFVKNYDVRRAHKDEMGTMMLELKDIIVRHQLRIPSHFYLFVKSLVSVEATVRQLDPDMKISKAARPYMLRAIARHYNPLKFGRQLLNTLYESSGYLEDFPRDLKNAIRRINSGEVKVQLQHKGIDPLIHTMNRTGKQLVAAMLVSALIVGSALIIVSGVPPVWYNVSAAGIVGLVLAFFISAGMVRDIMKGDHDE